MVNPYLILTGDCRARLADIDPDSVDSVVSDPPYGLEFMGQEWDSFGAVVDDPATVGGFQDGAGGNAYSRSRIRVGHQKPAAYQDFMFDVACGLLRAMKPGAYGLMFGGTRTYHRVTCALEDAGFEIRDCLGWLYGSGFPKSGNQKGDWSGFGTALKPAWEPIILFRKPSKLTVPRNLETWGVGALNIDGCRVGESGGTKGFDFQKQASVNTYGNGLNGKKCQPLDAGRWPANILHDGSEEVESLFPNQASRFFYCPKASRKDRDEGLGDDFEEAELRGGGGRVEEGYEGSGDGLREAAGKFGALKSAKRNTHPTVKPTDLMRYLCRLVTPPGGLVLDPFTGSGSTGKAVVLDGFRFLGIEKNPEYARIAEARIRAVSAAGAPAADTGLQAAFDLLRGAE